MALGFLLSYDLFKHSHHSCILEDTWLCSLFCEQVGPAGQTLKADNLPYLYDAF